MRSRRRIGIVVLGLVMIACTAQSQENATTVHIFRYSLPSRQITQGILLEFYCDGLLKRAEVRSIDQLSIEEARVADFNAFSLVSEADVTRAGESITIEVNRVSKGERIVRSLVPNSDGAIEIRLPDRPNDRAMLTITDGRSTYAFNGREISSLAVAENRFIRETRRLRYEYGREFGNGEIGRVFRDGIGVVTAITHHRAQNMVEFEHFESHVPFWYRFVYSALPPQMDFRTAVLSDSLITYAVADAFYRQLFPLIAASVR
jgi:hypothetical protein